MSQNQPATEDRPRQGARQGTGRYFRRFRNFPGASPGGFWGRRFGAGAPGFNPGRFGGGPRFAGMGFGLRRFWMQRMIQGFRQGLAGGNERRAENLYGRRADRFASETKSAPRTPKGSSAEQQAVKQVTHVAVSDKQKKKSAKKSRAAQK